MTKWSTVGCWLAITLSYWIAGCSGSQEKATAEMSRQKEEPESKVSKLIDDLESNDVTTRLNALNSLYDLGAEAKPALSALAGALGDDYPMIRESSAKIMTQIYPEGVMLLARELVRGAPVAQFAAANELNRIGHKAKIVVSDLAMALDSSNPSIVALVAETFGALGKDSEIYIPKLRKLLNHKDPFVRMAASISLFKLQDGSEASVAKLREFLRDRSDFVKLSAAKAARDSGMPIHSDEVVIALVGIIGNRSSIFEHRRQAMIELVSIPRPVDALPTVIKVLSDRTEGFPLRMTAAECLGAIGIPDRRAILALEGCLEDDRVAFAAQEALKKLKGAKK